MIKANPSPNGNGFAFNLFGEPKNNIESETKADGRIPSAFCVAFFAVFIVIKTPLNRAETYIFASTRRHSSAISFLTEAGEIILIDEPKPRSLAVVARFTGSSATATYL